jgi:nitronate monooxygenase
MAGGLNTPELAAAVGAGGGLGSFGFAYSSTDAIRSSIERTRSLNPTAPVNANFFVFSPVGPPNDRSAQSALGALQALAPAGVKISMPTEPYYPDLEEQLDAVWAMRPDVLTFHFGIPKALVIQRAHELNITVGMSATSLDEALNVVQAGADFIVAQGIEAGGHRGTFNSAATADEMLPTMELVRQLTTSTTLMAAHQRQTKINDVIPIVAAGGIMNGQDVTTAIAAGAAAVQMGTAFLTTTECGASATFKQCLMEGTRDSIFTKGFSGRSARGLENEFMVAMRGGSAAAEVAVLPFPLQNTATAAMRKRSEEAKSPEQLSMWAGAHYRKCCCVGATELIDRIAAEIGQGTRPSSSCHQGEECSSP